MTFPPFFFAAGVNKDRLPALQQDQCRIPLPDIGEDDPHVRLLHPSDSAMNKACCHDA